MDIGGRMFAWTKVFIVDRTIQVGCGLKKRDPTK